MSAIYCQQCGRANGASSKVCLWCSAAISDSTSTEIETTTLEVDYVSGIDRLDNPGPVRMVISTEGIEIAEILPGSRSFKIPAISIIEVNVSASNVPTGAAQRPWWRRMFESRRARSKQPIGENNEGNYIFTVTFEQDNEVGTMVFRRYDLSGHMPVWRVADTLGRLTGQRRVSQRGAVKRLFEKS